MLPSTGTIALGCVNPPRGPCQVAVSRHVGGRLNEPLIETLAILRVVARAEGRGGGMRKLILPHHADCGIIGCHRLAPDLLARHLGL